MTFNDFEEQIWDLLATPDEDGIWMIWNVSDLELFIHADGCLGARYLGEPIRSEAGRWEDGLDAIIDHIKAGNPH